MTITPKEVEDLLAAARDKSNPNNLPRHVWASICECANIALEIKVYQIADLVAKQAAELARLQAANDLIAPWLSAALEDSLSGVEFKKDVEKWFELVEVVK
jgi:hypothetical protein